ncbi:CDK-activating kinase assembly factor [Sistotremastrum niveocremeum HHB9708]|uniref:RNA polymerase II transcription factor B subunit 3 n=1 Tax=Sistotremastrum niveocremeum HHB9708 TaxID=1314777 RepID=A0A165AKR4_9AGAM|nr:CDK-activating kinase assembly factor [Sistotremastrum niveocremeum HHB9708]
MSSSAWARGVVVRKGGTSSQLTSRSGSAAPQPTSTSSTTYGGGVKDPSGRVIEYYAEDDQCPVCKSDRYLNPKLRLLVSACYHKMCESCIDRLFTLGPAPCPICNKTLRKIAFTPQTFEDLGVEKEVAVRRRMAREFNRHPEDFTDLRAYNDYLETVEDITFNLINDVDVAKTEARITALRAENAALTELNIQRDEQAASFLRQEEERERQEREERARDLRRQEEEEREEHERHRMDIINNLERGTGDAAKIVAKANAVKQKRTSARNISSIPAIRQPPGGGRPTKASVIPDEPHVPLTDSYYAYEDKFTLKSDYHDPRSEAVRKDRDGIMRAGGYRIEEAWERAIRIAVAGLEISPL